MTIEELIRLPVDPDGIHTPGANASPAEHLECLSMMIPELVGAMRDLLASPATCFAGDEFNEYLRRRRRARDVLSKIEDAIRDWPSCLE
jgi:hypothetical protein